MGTPDGITIGGLVDFKTTGQPTISKGQQMGEDIRAAKAIFENRFGEQTCNDVNLWLEFANEVREYMRLQTLQETAEKLEIKYRKP